MLTLICPHRRQKNGQAMVEFIIILPVLLFIILATLQFAFIYKAKITLNYATFESARAGSLGGARPSAMDNAMVRALAPLYTHADNTEAYITARKRIRQEIADGYLKIDVINPSLKSFDDYGKTGDNLVYIPNDNLIYREASSEGKDSEQTIQDANLLKIQSYYCFELIVPFVNKILWAMMRYAPGEVLPGSIPQVEGKHRVGRPQTGTFNEACVREKNDSDGYWGIPIRSQAIIRMQSDAILTGT